MKGKKMRSTPSSLPPYLHGTTGEQSRIHRGNTVAVMLALVIGVVLFLVNYNATLVRITIVIFGIGTMVAILFTLAVWWEAHAHAHNSAPWPAAISPERYDEYVKLQSTRLLSQELFSKLIVRLRDDVNELVELATVQGGRIVSKRVAETGSMIREHDALTYVTKKLAALLIKYGENLNMRWIWLEDLVVPGPNNPLPPIFVRSKLDADQTSRLLNGLGSIDQASIEAARKLLERVSHENVNSEDVRSAFADLYLLTARLLASEKKLRDIFYEQHEPVAALFL